MHPWLNSNEQQAVLRLPPARLRSDTRRVQMASPVTATRKFPARSLSLPVPSSVSRFGSIAGSEELTFAVWSGNQRSRVENSKRRMLSFLDRQLCGLYTPEDS